MLESPQRELSLGQFIMEPCALSACASRGHLDPLLDHDSESPGAGGLGVGILKAVQEALS